MILKYRDPEGKIHDFPWNPAKMPSPQTEALEEVGGKTWATFEEFGELFMRGSQKAYRAAVWLNLRAMNPGLKFSDVSITPEDVAVVFSDEEAEMIRQAMLADPELDEAGREVLNKATEADYWGDGGPLADQPPNSGADDSTSPTPDSPPVSENSTAGA